jgi:hypothetical protein
MKSLTVNEKMARGRERLRNAPHSETDAINDIASTWCNHVAECEYECPASTPCWKCLRKHDLISSQNRLYKLCKWLDGWDIKLKPAELFILTLEYPKTMEYYKESLMI